MIAKAGDNAISPSIKHQRSRSAPDEKAVLSSWSTFIKMQKEDIPQPQVQSDVPVKVTHSKTPESKKKDRLSSLTKDVEHLQAKLKGQKASKSVMEQALARASSVLIPIDGGSFLSQHTQSLIKDIALLELQVVHLEQHLLSLYRSAFQVRVKEQACISKILNAEEITASSHQSVQSRQQETPKVAKKFFSTNFKNKSGLLVSKNLNVSLANGSFNEPRAEHIESVRGKPKSSYSQPISHPEKEVKGSPSAVTCELWREVMAAEANASSSLGEASSGILCPETPNKLSEELVRCMAAIYCRLADPPISYLGPSVSRSPSYSSASTLSSRELSSDGWSPSWKTDPSCSGTSPSLKTQNKKIIADNNTSPYSSMVAVQWIRVDDDQLLNAEKMLENFRSLVQELERLNPAKLKHEEKLAFWINIYNALMMHAYLAYGIPRSQIKRASLLQKASYKIGSHSVNAHTIEHTLLGCRSHRPAQWIQALLSPGSKLKSTNRQAYALDRPEPLACFAICCGGVSDPALRVYTAKNIYQELDAARRDFLHSSVSIRRDHRILVPRVVESFARESSMGSSGLIEWISQNVSESQRREIRACMGMRAPQRCIEWVPYNFSFRYLFVRDLARWFPSNSSSLV